MTNAAIPIDIPIVGHAIGINVVEHSLKSIEFMLDNAVEHVWEREECHAIREELLQLHSFVRSRQAMDLLSDDTLSGQLIPPEFSEQASTLRREYSAILGSLDRTIRTTRSIAFQPLEDQDVFSLRTREMVALIRRHEAEKDRILDLAIWRETGGES